MMTVTQLLRFVGRLLKPGSCLMFSEGGAKTMTGHKIHLGKTARIKDGKIIITQIYRDASHAIRAKKSTKTRVVKRTPSP